MVLFDDPLWQTGASSPHVEGFIGRNSPIPRHFTFFPKLLSELISGAQKNSPKFCPTWTNPLNLASSTPHLYPNILMHLHPIPCECTLSQGQPMKFPPTVAISTKLLQQRPSVFFFFFFCLFFLALGSEAGRFRSFKEVEGFLSIVYEDLAFSTPVSGWDFTV